MAKKSKKKDRSAKGDKAGRGGQGTASVPNQRSPYASAIADKRRTKLRADHEAALATAELTGLDEQLEVTNAELRQLEVRREQAEQHLLELHNAIGAAQLTRTRIRSERKQARSRTTAAQERATDAERRYDSAVLAQLLDADLGHQDQTAAIG